MLSLHATKVNSPVISNKIECIPRKDDEQYYGFFLNAMATIARNFDARIIKNAGDCLIF